MRATRGTDTSATNGRTSVGLHRFPDAYLVERCREGSSTALRELYRRHFDDAYRYASIRTGSDRAEHIVWDAFAKVVDQVQRDGLVDAFGTAEQFGVRLTAALLRRGPGASAPRPSAVVTNGHDPGLGLDELSDRALVAGIGKLDEGHQEVRRFSS